MTGGGNPYKFAYLEEGELYYYAPDEDTYIALKRVGNLTFLEEEVTRDGKNGEREDRAAVCKNPAFGGENQGQGC